MYTPDLYHGGIVAGIKHVMQGDAPLIAVVLAYAYQDCRLRLYVEDMDPLTRLVRHDPVQLWDNLEETIYDVLHMAEPGYKQSIPFHVSDSVAVTYDRQIQDVFVRACGEHPVAVKKGPHTTYVYC